MLDITKLVEEVDFRCKIDNVAIFDNQDPEVNTTENRNREIESKVNQAINFAFNKRKGTDTSYTIDSFYTEVETRMWGSVIVNMAYTAFEKKGLEGHTALNVSGVNRTFESGGIYLLADVNCFIPLVGGV